MGPIYSLADFLDLVRRRLGLIIIVTILGCIASVIFALSQAHIYQSAEVIQVEGPKVSDDLARSTVEGSAARRLQLIEQQLMARDNVLRIIEEMQLFEGLDGLSTTERVALFRQSVTITGVAAVREGFADDGAISVLTITVELDDPYKAQAVAHGLAEQTRNLASAQRDEQTRETLAFFRQQEETLVGEIRKQEEALADFRRANDLSIEGSLAFRREELASLNDSLLELDRNIITTQLARTNIDRSGNTRAATIQRETEELTRQLNSLTTQRQLLRDRRDALSRSIETSPEVERGLAEFERRITQLQGQLEVVTVRRNEAEVAFTLEAASRGEQFVTLEEATVPELPITTARKNIALAGGVASLIAAIGLAFLLELRSPVLRTAAQMHRETGLMPVVSIPETEPSKERLGLARIWQDRRAAGKRGREARMARQSASKLS